MLKSIVLGSALAALGSADTAADCHYEEIRGKWLLHYTNAGLDNSVNCDDPSLQYDNTLEIALDDLNVAYRLDDYGTQGWFTLIYNQGFEMILDERKWFAYFWYNPDINPWDANQTIPDGTVLYDCSLTAKGWVHDVLSNDWACFYGEHQASEETIEMTRYNEPMGEPYTMDSFSWSPKEPHPSLARQKRPRHSHPVSHPRSKSGMIQKIGQASDKIKSIDSSSNIPQSFEWTDLGMVSPVKDQGNCGSCYSFASVGMFEARARVQTNGQWQPIFAEQDIVSCSQYSQGCEGGFPYLISKYAQDFGVVESTCLEYTASDSECTTDPACKRHHVADYGYVGNYYGGATEYLMRQEIFSNGPIAVSLLVDDTLHDYDGGIWIQTYSLGEKQYDPFEETNHVVLITGWGWDEETGYPFWNIKNSWGLDFGIDGYFKMIRGIDNAGVESLPAKCTMIPPLM